MQRMPPRFVNIDHNTPLLLPPGLLIYCYAPGIFSSRRIETQTDENIALRFLTGDTSP
jgi:hypothetical protein